MIPILALACPGSQLPVRAAGAAVALPVGKRLFSARALGLGRLTLPGTLPPGSSQFGQVGHLVRPLSLGVLADFKFVLPCYFQAHTTVAFKSPDLHEWSNPPTLCYSVLVSVVTSSQILGSFLPWFDESLWCLDIVAISIVVLLLTGSHDILALLCSYDLRSYDHRGKS